MTPSNAADGGPSVVIIGAGFAGIGMAARLRSAGFSRLTVVERAAGVGGTWWHNTYPGAEVDTPSMIYSFSFMPWNWSRTHCGQAELQQYLAAVADRFDLTGSIRLGFDVAEASWDDDGQRWTVVSTSGECVHGDVLVSAVGLLSDPRTPDLPGLRDFAGAAFHTSSWDHSVSHHGRRVAVVGTGSTAVQVTPAVAETAAHVTVFQREPGWIVPKSARAYTARERRALDSPLAQRIARAAMLLRRERAQFGGAVFRPGTAANSAAEAVARRFIDTALAERPDLVEAVTPKYVYAGKRPIISDDFYPTLLRDNVTLVPKAVTAVTATGVVDSDGREHPADILVLSTGFTAEFLGTLRVRGRDGRDLHEAWGDDVRAFLGMMVPGFPNLFIMYGPNTNGGAIVSNLELQADYVLSAAKRIRRGGRAAVEVAPWAHQAMDRLVQRRLVGTVFEFENNYYKSPSGRITTQWPDSVIVYALLTKLLRRPFWRVRRRTPRSVVRAEARTALVHRTEELV